jgi:hypothetical protein
VKNRTTLLNVERNVDARSCTHCCTGKATSITYSECMSVASGIQHAKRLHLIILSSVACLALSYFSTLFKKRHHFRGKKKECYLNMICHSKKNSDIIINVRPGVKELRYLSDGLGIDSRWFHWIFQ